MPNDWRASFNDAAAVASQRAAKCVPFSMASKQLRGGALGVMDYRRVYPGRLFSGLPGLASIPFTPARSGKGYTGAASRNWNKGSEERSCAYSLLSPSAGRQQRVEKTEC